MIEIKEYKTIFSDSLEYLDRDVSALLMLGWSLYGNPYVKPETQEFALFHCQAMILTTEEAE